MPETLAIVTPWYPSANKPSRGSFVHSQVRAVRPLAGRIEVLATEDWIASRRQWIRRVQLRHYRGLAPSAVRTVLTEDDVWLTRVPVLVAAYRPWHEYARAVADGARAARLDRRLDAAVVHAHEGLPGALVALELAEPGSRVVVTEHASFLAEVLAQDRARGLYDELMHQADAWICVSGVLRDQILEAFPHHADKVHVVGNPVDFDRIAVRTAPPESPRRWIYVGSMIERKGPLRLIAAFAQCRAEYPDLELTMLGSGAQREPANQLIRELGLDGAVRIIDTVQPHQVFSLMAEHDLLVHPSQHETFGLTPVEALATGTPVLVARYAAAREVLAGLESQAGGLFGIGTGPEEIVEAYQKLRARWDSVDPLAAREVLRARYGFESVANQLTNLYTGAPPPVAPSVRSEPEKGSAMTPEASSRTGPARTRAASAQKPQHVLVVSGTSSRRHGVLDEVRYLLDTGIKVTLLVMRASDWPELRGQVDVLEMAKAEGRHPLPVAERTIVFRIPNRTFRAITKLCGRAARVRGGTRPARVVVKGTRSAQQRYGRLSNAFHRKVFLKGYHAIRPWVLWRVIRSTLLPAVNLSDIDLVLIGDAQAVSIGWHIARLRPDLEVVFSLDRSELLPVIDDEESASSTGRGPRRSGG